MYQFITSWKRVLIYIPLIILITVVGNFGGWVMGLVLGLIFTLFVELFSFIRDDTVAQIDSKLVTFSKAVNEQISSLSEFKQVAQQFEELNIEFSSSALTKIIDIYDVGLPGELSPTFLLTSSIEPNIVAQDKSLTVLLLNATQAITLFVQSFRFVKDSYWGVSYTKPQTWEFAPIDDAMKVQRALAERGADIRRVFIAGLGDDKEQVKTRCKIHSSTYKLKSR